LDDLKFLLTPTIIGPERAPERKTAPGQDSEFSMSSPAYDQWGVLWNKEASRQAQRTLASNDGPEARRTQTEKVDRRLGCGAAVERTTLAELLEKFRSVRSELSKSATDTGTGIIN
jgi:hypothetical protein